MATQLRSPFPPESVPVLSAREVEVRAWGHSVAWIEFLDIRPGEIVHLTGENGAGKTTLLRALIAAGSLDGNGQCTVAGAQPGSVAARRATAFVPTDAVLPADLTVREWLNLGAALWETGPDGPLRAASQLGLDAFLDDWPGTLSRGTRQKVALSLAFGLARPLTILDEPFGTLDSTSRVSLLALIRERAQAGGAVLVVTHGSELESLAPRVVSLERGELHERNGATA